MYVSGNLLAETQILNLEVFFFFPQNWIDKNKSLKVPLVIRFC